jgi:KDO2-lipid IV(A) lauroyltransferase
MKLNLRYWPNTIGIPNYEITNLFLRRVEAQIVEALEFYLWTHRRWKHREKKTY